MIDEIIGVPAENIEQVEALEEQADYVEDLP